MPGRLHKLLNDGIYHIFNKTIDRKKLFEDESLCKKFLEIVRYYRSSSSTIRFSRYERLSSVFKDIYQKKTLDRRTFRISIFAYCLMPTHFHFLVKQNSHEGISVFVSQIQNSLTRYYNIYKERYGPIFLHRFKSRPIQSEEQLKHVSRYIHLNPFSSGIIPNEQGIGRYPWSSLHEYFNLDKYTLSEYEYILSIFKNKERYRKFVLDNAQHQRMLEYCKYTNKW